MSDSFHVEGAEVVFRSRVFNVERRTVAHGEDVFIRDVAAHPGAVAVLVFNEQGGRGLHPPVSRDLRSRALRDSRRDS